MSFFDLPPTPGWSASPPLAQLPPNSFFRLFVRLNRLEPISCFLFPPGMLFNDATQWWGEKSLRTRPHEGLDIFLMQDADSRIKKILPQMLIPAVLPGHPVHFHRDFLGETLYIRHLEMRRNKTVLHTIYGHTVINPGLRNNMTPTFRDRPSPISKGDILGSIAPSSTGGVPAHLHLSCAWIGDDEPMETLNWGKMAVNPNIIFVDPLPFLSQ